MNRRRCLMLAAAVAAVFATAASPADAKRERPTLVIQTVPALQGLDFSFRGRTYTSSRTGVVRIEVPANGTYGLRALLWRHRDRGVRVSFARWGDDAFKPLRTVTVAGHTRLEAGYVVSYLVRRKFIDLAGRRVDPARVTSVTLTSSLGEKFVLRSERPKWLEGSRVARRLNGLEKTIIRYAVMAVRVSGTNVVNQAQQRFYVARTPTLRIRLSLYSASFSSADLIFGKPVGAGIILTYPDGTVVRRAFHDGSVTLRSLPRGQYEVKVETGRGISLAVPVALSRNQDVPLKVISYADLVVIFVLFGGISIGLVVARRPALRPTALVRRLLRASRPRREELA